jgi:hypothetical protein
MTPMPSGGKRSPWVMTATGGPRVDWKAERDRIDLASVATRLLGPAPGRCGQRGRRLWWNCPFHDDPNPSFCVDPGMTWWRCFGCGEHGDAATLVMKLEGLSFPEAITSLAGDPLHHPRKGRRPATPPPRPKPSPRPPAPPSGLLGADALALVESAESLLWSPEGSAGLTYLEGRPHPDASRFLTGRCLGHPTIRSARLGWTSRAEGVAWKPPGIVLPWFVGGRLALVKVRVPDPWLDRFPKRDRPPRYIEAYRNPALLSFYPGPEAIRPGHPLIVVEGEFDALCLGEALGPMAAVVTLGSVSTPPTPAILSRMLSAAPWFLATDADPAGDGASGHWPASTRRVRPPGRYKDWTEARQAGVDLRRWWGAILAGESSPPPFTRDELAGWRWGESRDDPAPGRVVDHPDLVGQASLLAQILGPGSLDPEAIAEREAIQAEGNLLDEAQSIP